MGTLGGPKIALDSSQRPNIVWDDNTGGYEIFFSKWNGTSWTGADGVTSGYDNVSNNSGYSYNPQIVLDSSQRPNIVWHDTITTTGNQEILFSKWNGTSWTKADGSTPGYDNVSNNSGYSYNPQIVLDSSQRPNIVWHDDTTGNGDIFFSKWNGTSWTKADGVTLGYDNVSNNSGWSRSPQIVLDSSQRPNIVWIDSITTTGNSEILFSKWNGTAWTRANGSTPGYDNVSNNSGYSYNPQMALDSSQRPNIVWDDDTTGNGDIFFSKWNGTSWTKADGVTLGYDNVSNNSGWSRSPQIVLDSSQRPNIVWDDNTTGNLDIFFSKWNGSQWTKADGVTPGYDDLSYNSGYSWNLQMVLDSSQRPNIVCVDNTKGNGDILFSKCTSNFLSPKQAQSTKINTDSNTIIKATLTTSENLNGGSINYYLSANGGTNWEQVTPNAEHIFTNQGNDLRWRAVLSTTDNSATPEIDSLTIDYSYDTTAPTGSIYINSDATFTTSNSVNLTLTATDSETGVTGMCFSNDNSIWSGWESFSQAKSWTLSSGDGTKTVYAKYKDGGTPPNESTYSDDIILDTQAPTDSIIINAGATYTTTTNVTLTLFATDTTSGVGEMMVSNDSLFSGRSWENYAASKSWALATGDGTKSVYVKYKDRAGNISNIYSDNIILDTTKPTGSILINNGSEITHSAAVILNLSATDNIGATQMIISNFGNFSGASWETFQTQKVWTLLPPKSIKGGESGVCAKFRDGAGNESDTYLDSINLIIYKFIERLYGETRYETAIAISKEGWPQGANKVILARGDLFPDALSGAPLAAKYNAPILLTPPSELNKTVAEEIKRLKAKEAIILGSEDALYPKVAEQLTSECGIAQDKITRLGGPTRYETSSIIAKYLKPLSLKIAFMATGKDYPDALSAVSIAAYRQIPILLVRGDTGQIPESIKDALKDLGITQILMVGQNDVLPDSIAKWLDDNHYKTTRLGGDTRYDTCKLIAEYGINHLGVNIMTQSMAFGENFPDALTLGCLAGKNQSPILLTRATFIPDGIKEFIKSHKAEIYRVYLAGGSNAVSDDVKNEIWKLINL